MLAILLSTFNGEKYLRELLDSLFAQTYKDFTLIIRDDGSVDGTICILEEYKRKHKNIILLNDRENKGVVGSFSYLLEYAVHNTNCDYFMFCDQDDVWKENKIEITLNKMQEIEEQRGKDIPVLIHTDLEVVDKSLKVIHHSLWKYCSIYPQFNTFNRLLLQNPIYGCTIMINKALANIVFPIPQEALMHDRWIGLVASQFGTINYIKESTIKYRQHSSNDTGVENYKMAFLKNIFNVAISVVFRKGKLYNEQKKYLMQAAAFLKRFEKNLDFYTFKMLEEFVNIEKKPYFKRRAVILRYKILKQGILRNIGLLLIL